MPSVTVLAPRPVCATGLAALIVIAISCGGGTASPPALDVLGDVGVGDRGEDPDPGHVDDRADHADDELVDELSSDGDIIAWGP